MASTVRETAATVGKRARPVHPAAGGLVAGARAELLEFALRRRLDRLAVEQGAAAGINRDATDVGLADHAAAGGGLWPDQEVGRALTTKAAISARARPRQIRRRDRPAIDVGPRPIGDVGRRLMLHARLLAHVPGDDDAA